MKKSLILLIKIVVSLTLLLYLFTRIDVRAVETVFYQLVPSVILVAIILQTFSVIVSAFKWRIFLPEYSLASLIRFSFIGQLYLLMLPGQLAGEAVKAYRLGGSGNMHRVASSVLIDKITGIIGLALVCAYGIWASSLPGTETAGFGIAIVIGVGTLFFFSLRTKIVYKLLADLLISMQRWSLLQKPAVFFSRVVTESYQQLQRTYAFVAAIGLGVLFQLLLVSITAFLGHALGIDVSFADWCWIFGVVSLIVLLPVTIAGLGVREVSMVSMLALLGVEAHSALALSFSILGLQLVGAMIGGLLEGAAVYKNTVSVNTQDNQ